MSLVDELVDATPQSGAEGPGARLRAMREARGIERGKVAVQLHLSDAMVAALEQDEYSGLPGSVFVRGYLRNYARLLGMSEGPVLEAYAAHKPRESVYVPPAGAMGIRKEQRLVRGDIGRAGGARWLPVVLMAMAVAGGAWWWFDGRDRTMAGDDRQASGPMLELGSPQALGEPPSEPESAMTLPPPVMAETGSQGEDTTPPRAPAAEPEVTSAESMVESPAADTVAAAAEAPAVATPPADGVETRVVFEFRERCWVDVRDSQRRRQLFGVMKEGSRHELGGTPPYSVVLGNAPAVRIIVNGEDYDVTRHSRGAVARFTLGS